MQVFACILFQSPSGFLVSFLQELMAGWLEKIYQAQSAAQLTVAVGSRAAIGLFIKENLGVILLAGTAIAGTLALVVASNKPGRERASKGEKCELRDGLNEKIYEALNKEQNQDFVNGGTNIERFRQVLNGRGLTEEQILSLSEYARGAGIRRGSLIGIMDIAQASCIDIRIRFTTRDAPYFRNLGYSPKPVFVKPKTINGRDRVLLEGDGREGLVGFFDPNDRFRKETDDEVWDRYWQRQDEWDGLHAELAADSQVRLEHPYVVDNRPRLGEGLPNPGFNLPFTGDVDLFDFTDPNTGRLIREGDPRYAHAMGLLQKLTRDVTDTEHPPLRYWNTTNNFGYSKAKQGLLDNHKEGELLQLSASGAVANSRFSPHESPYDYPLDEYARDPGHWYDFALYNAEILRRKAERGRGL